MGILILAEETIHEDTKCVNTHGYHYVHKAT